ncbi:MAG: NapC/NirT family cytochrome c [Chloroflexi bacterium]|nr:NapC/NirT family cytochrome c [Chloroflexota bacterium]MBP7042576.1 NapC/NirT family cytochrome c [Chloroflexota bacterium]
MGWFKKRPTKQTDSPKKRRWWRRPITLDLSLPKHRWALGLGFLATVVLSTAFIYANYRVYEYTESAEFCGALCHPMAPQMTRYEHSDHASVACVDCHIGPGTTFFIRSKIDGIRQVYAVLADTYSRPIKSPVHNLRPARETCETCHSPTSYEDNIVKTIIHYDSDEANTKVQSTLILKMGGWEAATGVSEGIHWHITNPVYYIAADEQRQVISWVGVEQPDGSMTEYFARDMLTMAQTDFVEEAYAAGEVRLMDCIDCHNRAAHYVPSPQESVDAAIEDGRISQNIPYIRAKAVELLSTSFTSTEEAYAAIEALALTYNTERSESQAKTYAESDTGTYRASETQLAAALQEIQQIYSSVNFPEMGLDWQTNPNNERHTPSLGCFRCHDGKHVKAELTGPEVETISVKCNQCHTVPIVGRGETLLVESPVIVGDIPESHEDFSWTIEHRNVKGAEEQACYQCHGQGFCNNGVCHNLSHPPDMLYTHADEYRKQGEQVCYTCHQDILCSRCHLGGVIKNP